jgi:prepilin-type N-terminal cleavage/methylation domain-containing protein
VSSASRHDRRGQRGFTLLEVMCAFAILTLMTGTITVICHQATETGGRALDLRELREAADTVFRVVLYEDGNGKWQDGQTGTLDHYYGDFAHLRGPARDRWKAYGMEYHRRAKTAAGSMTSGEADPLFASSRNRTTGTPSSTNTTGTGTTGTPGTPGSTTPGSTTEETGEVVWQITLRIYRMDEPTESLLTLQTFLPRQPDAGAGSSSAAGSGTPR